MSELSSRLNSNIRVKELSQNEPVSKSQIKSEKLQKESHSKLKELPNFQNDICPKENNEEKLNYIKRVNSLLVEVDRLSQENTELVSLLHEEKMRVGEIQRKSKTSGKIKKTVDRTLQSELKYEKEECIRLRHLLTQIENERAEMRAKLKDYEIANSGFAYEKKEMMNKIQQKSEQVALMENYVKDYAEQVLVLTERCSAVKIELERVNYEKNNMCQALTHSEEANSELRVRINEERAKNLENIAGKISQIDNLKWVHHKHGRLLAARNIAKEIERMKVRITNQAFAKVCKMNKINIARAKGMNRIAQLPDKYFWRKKKYFIDVWRSHLNWKSTQISRINLVDNYSSKILKEKIFREWKTHFFSVKGTKAEKYLSSSKFAKLFKLKLKNNLGRRFITWKRKVNFGKNKSIKFSRLSLRTFTWKLRMCLSLWQKNSLRLKEMQAKDDLAVDFSCNFVKSKYFQAIKEYTKIQSLNREFKSYKETQADKFYKMSILIELKRFTQLTRRKSIILSRIIKKISNRDKRKAWNKWLKGINLRKSLQKLLLFTTGQVKRNDNCYKEKVFCAWKIYFISNKLKHISGELSVEKPQREEYQKNLNSIVTESLRNKQISAGKVFFKCCKGRLLTYFNQWRLISKNFKSSLPKVKRVIFKKCMNKIYSGFEQWKKSVIELNLTSLIKKNAKRAEETQLLLAHTSALEEALNLNIEKQSEMAKSSMRSALLTLKGYNLTVCIRAWAHKALAISNKYNSAYRLEEILRLYFLSNSLNCLKNEKNHQLSLISRQKKLYKISVFTARSTLHRSFKSWKYYHKVIQNINSVTTKFSKRKNITFKQISINLWKSVLVSVREQELRSITHKIQEERNTLNISLMELSQNYGLETGKSAKMLKKLTKNCRLRIINALIRCSQGSQRRFWDRWRNAIFRNNEKAKTVDKLRRLWTKTCERRAWRIWIININRKIECIKQLEIKNHIKNSKAEARKAREIKNELEVSINLRNDQIKLMEKQIEAGKRMKNFFIARSVKQGEEEYSISRAAFAFKLMKDRFIRIKYTVLQLVKRIDLIKKKNILGLIKRTAQNNLYFTTLRKMLSELFKKYTRKYLKSNFNQWQRNSTILCFRKFEKSLISSKYQVQNLQDTQKIINNNYRKYMWDMLLKKNKQNIFNSWSSVTKNQKTLKRLSQKFATISATRIKTKVLSKLYQLLANRRFNSHNRRQYLRYSTKTMLTRCFNSWKAQYSSLKSMYKILSRIENTHCNSSIFFAFSSIKCFITTLQVHKSWKSRSQTSCLSKFLLTKLKNSLQIHFRSWLAHSSFKSSSIQKLRNSFLHALHRKFRRGFSLWQEANLIKDTESATNQKGPVAIANTLLKERNFILEKLIKDEGIDARYVERYLTERESLAAVLTRKGISHARARAGPANLSCSTIVPKMFLTWKLWTSKRKRIQKNAYRMLVFRKKPELVHGFLTWKHGLTLVANAVRKYPRRELYGVIARMDRDIKTMEGRVESTSNELLYMQAYSGILEEHAKRGQSLAVILCKNNVQKTFFRSLLRWQVHTNLCKVQDLLEQLTRAEENFFRSQSNFKIIEEENKEISRENGELRMASLDGVAIAEAFETISKEREGLSKDLAERSLLVKRLLEHNNDLTLRLKQLGIEEKMCNSEPSKQKRY